MELKLQIQCLLVASVLVALVLPVTAARAQNGPFVNYIGVLNANGIPLVPSGTNGGGVAVYQLPGGSGFTLVIEGRPGSSHPVGTSTLAADPSLFPDLQVQVDHPLGDGSPAVCDDLVGGVAAIPTPSFADTQQNAAAINDFSCRFVDGLHQKMGRTVDDACTFSPVTGDPQFMLASSTVQFCASIVPLIEFHAGDTLVSVRLRDTSGGVSAVSRFIVEAGSPPPSPTPTATPPPGGASSPTRTATASATVPATAFATVTTTRPATSTATLTLAPTSTPTRTPTSTIDATPTLTQSSTATPTTSSTPTPKPCVGDCNDDDEVTVNELIQMVNIALGNATVATCRVGDANGDGEITVNEIVAGVNNALNGCASVPTPTPTLPCLRTGGSACGVTPTP